jgi:hypothetical protein
MRHADYRTTLKHYTMLSLADTTAAMHRLPGGGGTSAPRAQVSVAEVQAPVSGDGKTRPQQIPQHSEHDHERVGATTCDDAIESDDDDPGSKLAPSRDLRDKAPRRARLCSVRGARRKHDRFSLGNRRSILLSYGRAKGESNSAAAVCPGLRQRACEHGHRLRYTARSPVQGLNRNSISNPAVSPVLVIAR